MSSLTSPRKSIFVIKIIWISKFCNLPVCLDKEQNNTTSELCWILSMQRQASFLMIRLHVYLNMIVCYDVVTVGYCRFGPNVSGGFRDCRGWGQTPWFVRIQFFLLLHCYYFGALFACIKSRAWGHGLLCPPPLKPQLPDWSVFFSADNVIETSGFFREN